MDGHNAEHHEHFKNYSIKRNSKRNSIKRNYNDIRAEVEI